ncbi:MAG: FAD-dependent thymidylate synthase [Candidatus Saccharimonas sp.]
MGYDATVIADSVTEAGDRLTTMIVTFPRIVLAEFNTHRAFSRNSASSRAIPVEKQLKRILNDPFIPEYWGANQPGMQAAEQLLSSQALRARIKWMGGCLEAVERALALHELGVHKQLANRPVEPFMWHTVIVTATEWRNFFALRNNEMAQPEIHRIAGMMHELYDASTPLLVQKDAWHLPLIQPEEYNGKFEFSEEARKISAARCARVSYLTHDGKRDLDADLTLYERLVSGGHMSPLEHVATPAWERKAKFRRGPDGNYDSSLPWLEGPFIGNFRGWKQLRKFVPSEYDYSLVARTE